MGKVKGSYTKTTTYVKKTTSSKNSRCPKCGQKVKKG